MLDTDSVACYGDKFSAIEADSGKSRTILHVSLASVPSCCWRVQLSFTKEESES